MAATGLLSLHLPKSFPYYEQARAEATGPVLLAYMIRLELGGGRKSLLFCLGQNFYSTVLGLGGVKNQSSMLLLGENVFLNFSDCGYTSRMRVKTGNFLFGLACILKVKRRN